MNHYLPTLTVMFLWLTWCATVSAAETEEQAAWEVGLGIAALSQPHYLGADDSRAYVLPIPYFKYYGDVLRADRSGIRAKLFESNNLSVGISGGGSFGVDSEDSTEREGMPDLDVLAELGPNLRWDIVENDQLFLQFQWPFRAAFSFGDKFGDYQGWTSNPRLAAVMPAGEWELSSTFGPIFSDQNYHQYNYGVEAQFVTASRPFYRAESGYTGLRWGFSLERYFKRKRNDIHARFFVRYFNMNGAENSDSPLFRREHNFSAGLTVSWVLKRSKRMVQVESEAE